MKRNKKAKPFERNKAILLLNLIKSFPKICFRFCHFLIARKKLEHLGFRSANIYSIQGTLNQLIWKVEHPLFIILSNSNRIFFKSDELVFKVHPNNTKFSLTAYGIGGKKTIRTNIKVVSLNFNDFNGLQVHPKRFALRTKTLKTLQGEASLAFNNNLSFHHKTTPHFLETPKIQFCNVDIIRQSGSKVFNTKTLHELNSLKEKFLVKE